MDAKNIGFDFSKTCGIFTWEEIFTVHCHVFNAKK